MDILETCKKSFKNYSKQTKHNLIKVAPGFFVLHPILLRITILTQNQAKDKKMLLFKSHVSQSDIFEIRNDYLL